MTRARLSLKTWMSMSDPLRTWPVRTLPISRGRNRASRRISRRASTPHVAEVLQPLRPLVHAGHGLDLVADLAVAWAGRRAGSDTRRPSCLAALRLAVKYSDSVRWYIIWAARKAICRRMRSSAMWGSAPFLSPSRRRGAGETCRRGTRAGHGFLRVRLSPSISILSRVVKLLPQGSRAIDGFTLEEIDKSPRARITPR